MRVNEILSRVEDEELIYLRVENFGIMQCKHEIMKDEVYKNEHFGGCLVTNISVSEVRPDVNVLEINAVKPGKKVKA